MKDPKNLKEIWEKLSIGSDESGKGDFFGGPVVAAVNLTQEVLNRLQNWPEFKNIKDSKECTDDWIQSHAEDLMDMIGKENLSVVEYNPTKYNAEYQRFGNMNALLAHMHNTVHSKWELDDEECVRIVDGFVKQDMYEHYLSKHHTPKIHIHIMESKAEAYYLSVALASVIARFHYIQQMNRLREKAGGYPIPYGNAYSPEHKSVVYAYISLLEDEGWHNRFSSRGSKNKFSRDELDRDFVKANFSTIERVRDAIKALQQENKG